MRLSSFPRWARALLAGVVGSGVVAVVAAAGSGHPAEDPRLLSGAAWLSSSGAGQVTLLDGASAEVAAQVRVAKPGNTLDVVQQGPNAYAVNRTTGTLRRVDGATFELTPPGTPIPDADTGLTAFAGPRVLYALDTERGVLVDTEPKTLTPRSDPLPLATRLADGAAALDSQGTLWVLDAASGDLTRIQGAERTTRRLATPPKTDARLTLAAGNPVLINTTARTASTLDPDTGEAAGTLQLDLREGEQPAISGSPHTERLYVVTGRGVLAICPLTQSTCDRIVPLDAAGHELGPPVEAANRVFIPDYTTGRVFIVNLATNEATATRQILNPAGKFQLLNHDGVVFFNDPNTERAGVIRLDGTVTEIQKYDPKNPNKGLTNPIESSRPQIDDEPRLDKPKKSPEDQPRSPDEPQDPNQPPDPADPDLPPPDPNDPIPPTTDPPPPTTGPPDPPPEGPELQITLSDTTPTAGEDITLRVRTTDGQTPATATWNLGDGTNDTGDTVTHQWTEARTYQVSVEAVTAGKRSNTSLSVTVDPGVSVVVSAVNSSYSGRCPPTSDDEPYFQADISVESGPTTVKYRWRTSDGGGSDPAWKTIEFTGTGHQVRQVSHSEPTPVPPGETHSDWIAIDIAEPVTMQSNRVDYSITCTNVSVFLEATKSSYTGPCPPPSDQAPSFSAVISVESGPTTVKYRWSTSNGGSSDPDWKTIEFTGTGHQEQTVTHSETSYLPGQTHTDWMVVYVSEPEQTESNHVDYSTTCL